MLVKKQDPIMVKKQASTACKMLVKRQDLNAVKNKQAQPAKCWSGDKTSTWCRSKLSLHNVDKDLNVVEGASEHSLHNVGQDLNTKEQA